MKINNIAIGTVFVLGLSLLSTPAFAEEVAEEPPVVEEAPAPEPEPAPAPEPEPEPAPEPEPEPAPEPAPEPEPSYTPPPEAYEGVGGWAVVDPNTGKVHGVVVCQAAHCAPDGNSGGVTKNSYMGCPAGCVYRFQSRAQESGNVVGMHSDGYNSVTWDGDDRGTFSVNAGKDGGSSSSTLVPSKTMADGNSMSTGFINTRTKSTTEAGVKIDQFKEDYEDTEVETDILFPEWGVDGKLFPYISEFSAQSNLESDVDRELLEEGYSTEQTTLNEETEETTTETVVDEENEFVKTVRVWTESVIDFFRGIFS